MMDDRYPMRTLAEAEQSIRRAAADCEALRISKDELMAVRAALHRRIGQIKKAALLSSAARISVRSEVAPPSRNTSAGGAVSSRQSRRV
jgi:hypothetical protein